ncbi:TPA: hypothetical protein N0F65_003370 [Lagenidium giganteum]|uniref:Uncharacterized protein n=1 Tax=Lagenidium giganteum TaxID=4803 RepID=A0AAV2ZD58_9STRA|nr:TPA: hypothetical protein N0F65_003370 [Lagenidium giganteum]
MSLPAIADDRFELITSSTSPGISNATTDVDVRVLVEQVLDLSVNNPNVRRRLELAQDFAIDLLPPALTTDQHHLISRYYGLVLQSSEVFAARYKTREETMIVVNTTGQRVPITISCTVEDATVQESTPKNGTTLQPVNFQELTANRPPGWTNSLGLITLVDFFHQLMRRVFSQQDWQSALNPYQDTNGAYNPCRLDTGFDDHGRLALVSIHPMVKKRAKVIFGQNLSVVVTIGAGAGAADYDDRKSTLVWFLMTRKSVSSAWMKRDRHLHGTMLMGSSIRAVWHFLRYPNRFYSYLALEVYDDRVVLDFKLVGAFYSGFNGLKFFLATLWQGGSYQSSHTNMQCPRLNAAFAQEQAFANWFRDRELAPETGLVANGCQDPGTNCNAFSRYQGLIRKLAQVTWVMALRFKPVMNHLPYASMVMASYDREFVFNMLLAELNATYMTLIELENGLTQFHDAMFCPIGADRFEGSPAPK